MHLDVLIEDLSGKKMVEILLTNILRSEDTFKIYPYKGIGSIPKNLNSSNAGDSTLLGNLPQILKGFGKTYQHSSDIYILVVCDLDDKCLSNFRKELLNVLACCKPAPQAKFCIAVEEGEAWLLGDKEAIYKAYPGANKKVLNSYRNDSICGTWEILADAIYNGGSRMLKKNGWRAEGREKSIWAERITPHMDVYKNSSPSFIYFRTTIEELMNN